MFHSCIICTLNSILANLCIFAAAWKTSFVAFLSTEWRFNIFKWNLSKSALLAVHFKLGLDFDVQIGPVGGMVALVELIWAALQRSKLSILGIPGAPLEGREGCYLVINHHPGNKSTYGCCWVTILLQEISSISHWFFLCFCSLW